MKSMTTSFTRPIEVATFLSFNSLYSGCPLGSLSSTEKLQGHIPLYMSPPTRYLFHAQAGRPQQSRMLSSHIIFMRERESFFWSYDHGGLSHNHCPFFPSSLLLEVELIISVRGWRNQFQTYLIRCQTETIQFSFWIWVEIFLKDNLSLGRNYLQMEPRTTLVHRKSTV